MLRVTVWREVQFSKTEDVSVKVAMSCEAEEESPNALTSKL